MGRGGSPRGRGEWDQTLPGFSETKRAETAGVSDCWSLRLSRLGELQARNGVAPSLGRRVGRERSSDQGGERCAVEEGVPKEASATASLRNLGGHTFKMLVPALLVLLFCLRGHAGTWGGGELGGGLFARCLFIGVDGTGWGGVLRHLGLQEENSGRLDFLGPE